MLTALHDLGLAARFCDRVYVLKEGKVYSSGKPNEIISSEMVKDLYQVNAEIFMHKEKLYIDYSSSISQ